MRAVGRFSVGGEPEQGADGGYAGVAGPHGVVPLVFQVVQEGADQGGVEVGEVEPARWRAGLAVDEVEEEPEAVPVGAHGVGAGSALAVEPLGEEGFEDGGERAHRRTSWARSTRSAARASSSGVPLKYQ